MIVYNDIKRQFVRDVEDYTIADKIQDAIKAAGLYNGNLKEYLSWQNSMQFMCKIVNDSEIDDEVRICVEYNIPLTSKRVDFIIAGADTSGKENIVIVELKQWQKAEIVADDMQYCVRTSVANSDKIVCHPSYQAYSYSCFLKNYSQPIYEEKIGLVPCAYLHNYMPEFRHSLSDPIYKDWYEAAPFFIKNETKEFSDFIKKYVTKKSAKGDLLYHIDNGRLKPTKALQDSLASMVMGQKEFTLLDEQAVCFDMCLKTMNQCIKDGKKRTIIIQGGPGTGKSVLAVNLLMEYTKQGLNSSYVTKNSAPREAFLNILSQGKVMRQAEIKQMFRSPFGLNKCTPNIYDCLIVDEAHRLVKQMYMDTGGENQVKECINAALLSIFLLDEDQAVTTKDIGSVDEVRYWCKQLGSSLVMRDETKLVSQFRCNGSDSYIQFLDEVLQRHEESIQVDLSDLNFKFEVFDTPKEMREALRKENHINNKSRMVAGYCYDWNVRHRRGEWDIMLEGDFKAKWNLENDKIWAINPDSFEEVGCIHTAQGLEFDFVGVLIGKDLKYDPKTGKIITDRTAISKDDKSSGIRSADPETAHRLILNTYKTLLTRGQKGCFVYCEDPELRRYIRSKYGNSSIKTE